MGIAEAFFQSEERTRLASFFTWSLSGCSALLSGDSDQGSMLLCNGSRIHENKVFANNYCTSSIADDDGIAAELSR